MKHSKHTLVLCLLALSGCGFMAGGELEGTVMPAPSDWTEAAGADVVQLETRPEDPYSVHLWVIGLGPNVYVHAGANRAAWVEHMEANPEVRLKIGESIYELSARRVESAEEFTAFSDVYEIKYGNRPRNENVKEAYLFRLSPRSSQ